MRRILLTVAVALSVVGTATVATATSIQYQATNLPDLPGGGDLWQYDYFPSGRSFLADQGFAVFFTGNLYSALQLVSPVPVAWDPLVAQPIPALGSDGYYDALALVNNAPLTGPFRVNFVWLGPATVAPSLQRFEVYQLDALGKPVPFETGQTAPVGATAVPEPSTLCLLTIGVAVGRAWRRRRH